MNIKVYQLLKITVFNLLIVSFLGVIMRYKIAFYFPFLEQKHLQEAHSHFAFYGWISSAIYLFIHHTARKTFATTVLLNNSIPIETVSKLLGHSKITTTLSYYAEVMPSKLKLDLEGLRDKLLLFPFAASGYPHFFQQ
jgi:integrase